MTNPTQRPYRTLVRDVGPRTPCGRAPKSAVGDRVDVTARLVRDGHGLLAGRVRWRRLEPGGKRKQKWNVTPLEVDDHGEASAGFVPEEPGRYEFDLQVWEDRFGTWRRDLRLRAAAAEALSTEFLDGARLLERLLPGVPKSERRRVRDAVEQLEAKDCGEQVRLSAGLDDAVAEAVAAVPDPDDVTTTGPFPLRVDRELAVRGAWYEFFPRSEGGFVKGARSWERLERIAEAGFDVVYLPPIHPIGVTNRKGPGNTLVAGPGDTGSPWAIGSADGGHTAIDPDLGTAADFRRFVARTRDLGMEVALDYALQCSPDHPWVRDHPEWFTQRADGSIRYAENPPKKYQDIHPINFWPDQKSDRSALWEACRDILTHWIGEGVRTFRVDNPHTKPLAFWEWVIRDIQDEHPDVVFLAEAFTDPAMMHSLAEIGFSQSYTYFTWRTAKWELEEYGEELARGPASQWFRPNLWPNTPDILSGPLRNGTPADFAVRVVLAATMAPSWGMYSGFELCENQPASPDNEEYLRSEKYELKDRDWSRAERPGGLWELITRLNRIRDAHPAMRRLWSLTFHHVDHDGVIAYSYHRGGDATSPADTVLVVVNLSGEFVAEATVHLDLAALGLDDGAFEAHDELTGESYEWQGSGNYVLLDPAVRPGHVLALRPL
jgi:starch synthase (maltosyl-transferring)